MAIREVVSLNETTPELTVPQIGDTYKLPRATEVDSQLANTIAILTLTNSAGSINVFRVDATPEGAVAAGIGSIAIDATNGNVYKKETGVGNTGWVDIGGGGGGGGLTGTTVATYTFLGVNAGAGTASGNTCIGVDAGAVLAAGAQNTFIGDGAGDANVAGFRNIAVGFDAMGGAVMTSVTGYNVAIGIEALNTLTDGYGNIGIGYRAGDTITTGGDNVAIGRSSMNNTSTTAGSNVCIGFQAGNSVASNNVCIGHNANVLGQGSGNTCVGYQAMYSCQTTAANNACLGFEAGYDAGSGNVMIGYRAGKSLVAPANILHITNADTTTPLIYGEFANKNISFNMGSDFGGGTGVIGIKDATLVPSTNPTGGGILYIEAGALKYRGSSGTVTILGIA